MKNKISHISIAIALLISSSANAFWGSDISIEKEHAPAAPLWLKNNDNEVVRKVFAIDKSALPALNNYMAEIDTLFRLKYIDFDKVFSLDPAQLQLSYQGKESTLVRDLYIELINAVKAELNAKVQQRQQAILESEKLSTSYEEEILRLEANQQGYQAKVQAVYDLKEQTIQAKVLSEERVEALSAALVAQLNQHPTIPKPLKSNYFERLKMKAGACVDAVVNKKTSLQLSYQVEGFCFTSKFRVEKNSADNLLTDTQMISELQTKISAIASEKIKQGDTFKKQGGKAGYKQQIRAFSVGGIEDVKRAAKEEFGGTDKGLGFKIKSVKEKRASNNRKLTTQKNNLTIFSAKELKHSQALKALSPLLEQLDIVIGKYLNAQLMHIIGEPIKQSTQDYQVIEVDESEGLLLVEDSYPAEGAEQLELYLINPTILQQNSKIKRNYEGKNIPARAAVIVDGLLLWRGNEAYYARVAPSLVRFLSRM